MRILVLGLLLCLVWLYCEVALLLAVSHRIGALYALATTVLSGLVGVAIARAQGWWLLGKIRRDMSEGQLPVDSLLDGAVLFLAGILLIIPGLISDGVGLVLLIPWVRRLVLHGFARWWKRHTARFHGDGMHRVDVDIMGGDDVIDSVVVERRDERDASDPKRLEN